MQDVDIYEILKENNIELGSHESDLYVKKSHKSVELLEKYGFKTDNTSVRCSTFISQIDKSIWFDLPFQFMPFYKKFTKRG
jgi:hypothetical protein